MIFVLAKNESLILVDFLVPVLEKRAEDVIMDYRKHRRHDIVYPQLQHLRLGCEVEQLARLAVETRNIAKRRLRQGNRNDGLFCFRVDLIATILL